MEITLGRKCVQKLNEKTTRMTLISTFLIIGFLQSAALIQIGSLAIKPRHIVGGMLGIYLFIHKSERHFKKKEVAIIAFMIIHATIACSIWGFSHWYISMIFTLYSILIVSKIADDFSFENWNKCLKIVVCVIMVLVLTNAALQWDIFWKYMLQPNEGKPLYKSLLDGGANLDASWIGLFCFILSTTCWWKGALSISICFSVLANSRAGMLTSLAFGFWMIMQYVRTKLHSKVFVFFWNKKTKNKKRKISNLFPVVVFVLFFIVQTTAYKIQIDGHVTNGLDAVGSSQGETTPSLIENYLKRADLSNIGNEPGSAGRLRMWKWVPQEFFENPFGYGIGNGGLKVMENDQNISESNVHNIYFSVLLDEGFIGFIILVMIVFFFIRTEMPMMFANPLAAFLLCYLGLGFIQFSFLEIFMWSVASAYLNLKSAKYA